MLSYDFFCKIIYIVIRYHIVYLAVCYLNYHLNEFWDNFDYERDEIPHVCCFT